jgi:phosphohistidine phosphatase
LQIYLLRHAIASERDAERYADDGIRPLTREGRRRMARAARGMKALGLRFDLILTSPLRRAAETAQIVARTMRPRPKLKVLRPLAPGGGAGGILAGLSAVPADAAVVLVGHEPDLSRLAGALVLERRDALTIEFKKGALCRIDIDGAARLGAGKLVFHLPPRVLRGLRGTIAD